MKRMSQRIVVSLLICLGCAAVGNGQLSPIVVEQPPMVEELPPAAQAIVDGLGEIITATPGPRLGSVQANPSNELVTERYEDGKVKIEREVVQDQDQNYVNHGKWKSYDRSGNTAIEGRFKLSEMDGVWTRVYREREPKLMNIAPFNQGQLPIVSQANFKDGKLHGKWVIFDAHKRRLCEWEFSNGKRDGTSTWWFASGMKMREISYKQGTIDGPFNEWDRTGRQVTTKSYINGSELAKKTEYFSDRRKRAEGTVLYPKLVLDQADDWMNCTLATYTMDGEPVKQGTWTSWYPNGQTKHEGKYINDVPTGQFTWWHDNGQRSLVASYNNDGKKDGTWTWWHPNGLKSIQGEYAKNTPSNKWLWWAESGKVAQRADFNDPNQKHILAMPSTNAETTTGPSASVPMESFFK